MKWASYLSLFLNKTHNHMHKLNDYQENPALFLQKETRPLTKFLLACI